MGRGMPPYSALSLEQQAIVRASRDGAPVVTVASVKEHGKKRGEPSKVERDYGSRLESMRMAGELRAIQPQPEAIELGHRCSYTCDWQLVLADGSVEWHEVKGRKGSRPWFRDDGARVKVRVAARLLAQRDSPVALYVVWPRKGGGWCSERVPA